MPIFVQGINASIYAITIYLNILTIYVYLSIIPKVMYKYY